MSGRTYIRRAGDRRPQKGPRRIRFYQQYWTDPFWWIQGSVPEKMVMAELVRRGIYFEHTPQKNQLGGEVDPTWEADFLFPQYKIWLEVNGLYFHTLPGAAEKDAYRQAAIEFQGWKYIAFWDFDILTRLQDIMNAVPEFYRVAPGKQRGRKTKNLPFYEGGDGIDHLKGLRTQLSGRARTPQYSLRRYQNWDRSPK